MKKLPAELEAYRRTSTFDQHSVPEGFKCEHNTKAGVWGKLRVESGKLLYVITQPGEEETIEVDSSEDAIIAPEQKHHVCVDEEVKFYVEFYK